ncbi:ABC transporter substrate-binding protein [Rhodanobacter aciditrophus]|uniref:ABC transporter substrate-binding protein n=1 Tax=Rhodanobacter aciditrophus TaxID=1623218 RepID=A0ABW4B0C1_9GAMM
MIKRVSQLMALIAVWMTLPVLGHAEPMRVGFTGPFDGPNAYLGEEISRGIELGLMHINAHKSLNYDVTLVPMNDSYEPARTAEAITALVEEYDIKAMLGSVGTPTAVATLPLLKHYNVPLIAPLTGAKYLYSERAKGTIFNVRASYEDEVFLLVEKLVENLNIHSEDIAILAQKDAYGESGLNSLLNALKYHGIKHPEQALQIRYARNSPFAEHAAADILSHKKLPKIVFIIGTYEVASQLISILDEMDISPLYATLSAAGIGALADRTQHTKAMILFTQSTPPLSHNYLPLIKEFLTDSANFMPEDTPTNLKLEGYISARILGLILSEFHREHIPTSKSLSVSMNRVGSFDLGAGFKLALQSTDTPNHKTIWLRLISGGQVQDVSQNSELLYNNESADLANSEGHDYD